MGRFDRYMLGEYIKLFGFFGLVLVLIYWINRAVALFDALIADGQSALVFLELTTLTLPSIMSIVLPLAAFAAALYVTHRVAQDSELVVMQATGFSPFRLARPVLVFGLFTGVLMLTLTHTLVPLSTERLNERRVDIARNLTARLLTPGRFIEAGDGMTAYLREISPNGTLIDLMLSDRRDAAEPITYTARKAFLVKSDDGPKLVMEDGAIQLLRGDPPQLFVTSFEHLTYDVAQLIPEAAPQRRYPSIIPTSELLRASPELIAETGASKTALLREAHRRFSMPLLSVIAALVGFAPLILGGFSRFGLGPQMASSVGLVIVLTALDNVGSKAALAGPTSWPMTYLAPASGAVIVVLLLVAAMRGPVQRRSARRRAEATT